VKEKIDIKVIFILVLAGALVLSFIFRPSKEIDTYENEINALKEQNEKLLNNNDSLKSANDELSARNEELLQSIDSTKAEMVRKDREIYKLEDAKGKVSDRVRSLDANGVAESLTEYLDKRTE
jgi:peptidoglycan hydrolase CwlO-like protein